MIKNHSQKYYVTNNSFQRTGGVMNVIKNVHSLKAFETQVMRGELHPMGNVVIMEIHQQGNWLSKNQHHPHEDVAKLSSKTRGHDNQWYLKSK